MRLLLYFLCSFQDMVVMVTRWFVSWIFTCCDALLLKRMCDCTFLFLVIAATTCDSDKHRSNWSWKFLIGPVLILLDPRLRFIIEALCDELRQWTSLPGAFASCIEIWHLTSSVVKTYVQVRWSFRLRFYFDWPQHYSRINWNYVPIVTQMSCNSLFEQHYLFPQRHYVLIKCVTFGKTNWGKYNKRWCWEFDFYT